MSGVLELYAAGGLSADEKAEVEQVAREYSEVQAELDLIKNTFERYANLHAVTPPAHLKAKVLQAVAQQEAGATGTNLKSDQNIAPDPNGNGRVIPINQPERPAATPTFNWLVAAAVLLLILSNGFSYYFYQNWKKTERNLQVAQVAQQQYANNIEQVQQQLITNRKELALIRDANTRRVELKGLEKSPSSRVTVYWRRQSKDVYVNIETLPAAPVHKEYQLWAIVDGKTVDAGMIRGANIEGELYHMKNIENAEAFALTLEPVGGSKIPNLDEMYVMGKI